MKALVIDDHVLIRQAMQGVLKKLKRDIIVLDAASHLSAMRIMAENPDIGLVLLDLTLPDKDGFSVLLELRDQYPAVSVVVLSAVQDPANVRKALELGAMGYIPKSAQANVIINALRLVMSGGVYVPPLILMNERAMASAATQTGGLISHPALTGMGLTERQIEVLALVMQGKNNKTICRMLNLAEPTVKKHVSAILRALKVNNRTEAVIAASHLGLKVPAGASL